MRTAELSPAPPFVNTITAPVQVYRVDFRVMGGPAEVQVAAGSERLARQWARVAIDETRRIEAKYSRYRAESWVGRLNAAAGRGGVPADDETLALMGLADRLHRDSGGRFDASSGVLRRAWRFGSDAVVAGAGTDARRGAGTGAGAGSDAPGAAHSPRPPTEAELAPLRALVGWPRVQRCGAGGREIFLPEAGMELDFGGFGKEYAVDRAVDALRAAGAGHALVNLAGDCRALGPRPDGTPWSVGIAHPRAPGTLLAQVPLADGAVCSSGDYERGFWFEGRRFGHVLDALTGQPVQGWSAVSVLAPTAVEAGALATLALLAGDDVAPDGGAAMLLARCGRDWLGMDAQGRVRQPGGG